MRSYAKTIIASGKTLREEKDTYQSLMTFGDQDLIELYNLNRAKRQKVYVCTREMFSETINSMVNPEYYEYLKLEDLDPMFKKPYKISDALRAIKNVEGSYPILL